MGKLLSAITSIPENSSLVILGVALIASALILRRIIAALRDFARSNREHAARVNSLPGGGLDPSKRPDQVANA